MNRPVILVDIGEARLPEITPVVPVEASWVPEVYEAPPPPALGAPCQVDEPWSPRNLRNLLPRSSCANAEDTVLLALVTGGRDGRFDGGAVDCASNGVAPANHTVATAADAGDSGDEGMC